MCRSDMVENKIKNNNNCTLQLQYRLTLVYGVVGIVADTACLLQIYDESQICSYNKHVCKIMNTNPS